MSKHICVDIPSELKETIEFYNLYKRLYFDYFNSNLLVISNIEFVGLDNFVDFKYKESHSSVIIVYKHYLGLYRNTIKFGFNDFDKAFNFYNWVLSEKFSLEELSDKNNIEEVA